MADADIQKGLVGLEKLQVQNLKALVTLLLFFYLCMVWWKVESNRLKSFSKISSALAVLSSIFAANYQSGSMSLSSVFEKTVIWHFQEE